MGLDVNQTKIWVDKGMEFQRREGKRMNRSLKSWLKDNDTERYSTHNGKKICFC